MAVFRVERTHNYTVMSNHHLRDKQLSLKAKGLLSQMLSLPDNWDYTLAGLCKINRESKDALRSAVQELEKAGYIQRRQKTDKSGRFASNEYVIYECPIAPSSGNPTPAYPPQEGFSDPDAPSAPETSDFPSSSKPLSENPTTEIPSTDYPTQLNTEEQNTDLRSKDVSNTDSYPSYRSPVSEKRSEAMSVAEIEKWRELILENVHYDILLQQLPEDAELIDEVVELVVETVCCNRPVTRVGKVEYPHEIVRSRLLKLNEEHIQFVIHCLKENTTQIKNIRQYLLTMLFYAPTTINSYYTNRVNHDMHAALRVE